MDFAAAQRLLQDPDTLVTPLMLILEEIVEDPADLYGPDQLDPRLVFMLLEERYSVSLPEAARNRLQAAMLLRRSEVFETDVDAFKAVALAFVDGQLGNMLDGQEEEISETEALWAIVEASLVDPYLVSFGRAVSAWLDDLTDIPQEVVEEDDNSLVEMMEALLEQVQALALPAEVTEKIMHRAGQALTSFSERFGGD